jgi:hypothetical protein
MDGEHQNREENHSSRDLDSSYRCGGDWISRIRYHKSVMPFPIKVCTICSEEFELKPDKPGFANRCPECSAMDEAEVTAKRGVTSVGSDDKGLNEARRNAMRDLLYRKE